VITTARLDQLRAERSRMRDVSGDPLALFWEGGYRQAAAGMPWLTMDRLMELHARWDEPGVAAEARLLIEQQCGLSLTGDQARAFLAGVAAVWRLV
jgi:hypothetical protein